MNIEEKLKGILAELKAGNIVILIDEAHREDEGDLVMAAEFATTESINFMAREGRGLICVPMTPDRASRLKLPLMVGDNSDPYNTKFTVSVDFKEGTTTGISMQDRALTIRALANNHSKADEFGRPGHIFPLIADVEGLAARRGHTEATLALMKMAGLNEVGVICEIINDNGLMAKHDDLEKFAAKHNLRKINITDILSIM